MCNSKGFVLGIVPYCPLVWLGASKFRLGCLKLRHPIPGMEFINQSYSFLQSRILGCLGMRFTILSVLSGWVCKPVNTKPEKKTCFLKPIFLLDSQLSPYSFKLGAYMILGFTALKPHLQLSDQIIIESDDGAHLLHNNLVVRMLNQIFSVLMQCFKYFPIVQKRHFGTTMIIHVSE